MPAPASNQPRQVNAKVAVGCIATFLIPFFGAGLFAIGVGVQAFLRGRPIAEWLVPGGAGAFFLALSIALLAATVKGARTAAADAEFRARNPQSPWLWRKEWADGMLADRTATAPWPFVVFALLFCAVSSPVLFVLRGEIAKGNYVALVGLLFPLVGAGLLIAGLYQLLRRNKYGETHCRLDRIPAEPGRELRGDLQTHVSEPPPDGFLFKLTCLRRVTTGSGKSRSTTESILWRDEQTVRAVAPTPEGLRIPFTFTVPADAEPSDDSDMNNRIIWRLDVAAAMPGIDYRSQFELPVFNTANAPHTAVHFVQPTVKDIDSWQPEPDSLIRIRPTAEGEEIHVGTHAHLSETAGLGFFCMFWFGFIALMLRLRAPMLFPIVFGLFGSIIVFVLLDFTFGRSTITATRQALALRRSWFGIGGTRTIPPQQIESVSTTVCMTSGGGSGTPYYAVRVQLAGGRVVNAAKYLRSRRDADALAGKIERDCGISAANASASEAMSPAS